MKLNLKNNLDEMQEKKLLKIEHNGCWFAFWALLASFFIQQAVFGIENVKYFAGELIVFMCLALYLMGACLRAGIWDRRLKADPKTNLRVSILSAVIGGMVFSIVNYFNFHNLEASVYTFAFMSLFTFVLIFLALTAASRAYNKRLEKLEEQYDEE